MRRQIKYELSKLDRFSIRFSFTRCLIWDRSLLVACALCVMRCVSTSIGASKIFFSGRPNSCKMSVIWDKRSNGDDWSYRPHIYFNTILFVDAGCSAFFVISFFAFLLLHLLCSDRCWASNHWHSAPISKQLWQWVAFNRKQDSTHAQHKHTGWMTIGWDQTPIT